MADENDDTSKSWVDRLLDFGTEVGKPLITSAIYGKDRAYEMDVADEREKYNRINGSGAVNPNLYTPRGWFDFAFGNPIDPVTGKPKTGFVIGAGIGIVLLIIVLILLFRR